MRAALGLVSLLILPTALQGQACGTHCGSERWKVKTFTDLDTGKVNLTPVQETVHHLRTLTRPTSLPTTRRKGPVELTTYQVNAVLVGWKLETDQDFHVVIAEPGHPKQTMIVEIPDSTCRQVCTSPVLAQINEARRTVVTELGQPHTSFHRVPGNRTVTVTGIGFFDFAHGQTGRAPNSIELHPVIKFEFH